MQLYEYLPFFVYNTKEFIELFKILQPKIDSLFIETDKRLTDMFVLGCSEYATKRYEKIVGIMPKLTDSLEKRQLDILAIYNEVPPFTYERLEEMLEALLGKDGFKMSLDIPSYYLKIVLGQFTRNYTQTVKRAADNKRRYAPGEGSIPPVLLSGVSKGVPPLAHDFACKV